MTAILDIQNLWVKFALPEGELTAVKGVNFDIPQAKIVALVGESGSGKSVISQSIMGILPKRAAITGGAIVFNDPAPNQTTPQPVDIAALNPNGKTMRRIRGGRIAIVFQEPMTSFSPQYTIGSQIVEAARLHNRCSHKEAQSLSAALLQDVGFSDKERALRTYPFELSGGMMQRAMIAMALVCKPALLIADEPTTALDVTIQAQILALIKKFNHALDMSVLLITHDLGVVMNMADEMVVLYDGEIMEAGSMQDLFESPQHPYLRALFRAVPRLDTRATRPLRPIRDIPHNQERVRAEDRRRCLKAAEGHTILKVEGVSKTFFSHTKAQTRAVRDVSLTLQLGECLGLVGESGCGKTTLSKIILGATQPDVGSVHYSPDGTMLDVLALNPAQRKAFRRWAQFVFQNPFSSLNPRMDIEDILSEPLVIHNIGTPQERRAAALRLIRLVGLEDHHLKRYPHSFSGGQRQRIGIARALALKPNLLICDEPVSALDVSIQAQILNFLKHLKTRMGLSYIFVSHNMAVVNYIADRIAVMCKGRIVEMAPRKILFKNPVHPYTRKLLDSIPDISLERTLKMEEIMEDDASNPEEWAAPFTDADEDPHGPDLVEISPGHHVRLNTRALGRGDLKELLR